MVRTPLVRFEHDDLPCEVHLKLECLQPIGSFKLRGAGNALCSAPEDAKRGLFTASAGNMAQGVGWWARRLGVPFRVVVPEHAADAKLRAIERLGGRAAKVPLAEWWEVMETGRFRDWPELFVHPFADSRVMAGNGTIALEILEDLPDVDSVVVPVGGGGLLCGIAAALHELKPEVKVYAAEVETAAPLAESLKQGAAATIEYRPSFVDGIGAASVLPAMWPLLRTFVTDSIVLSPAEIADAIRLLVERHHVVAEGAAAASLAAARTGRTGRGKTACVVSGGNLDPERLLAVLRGEVPR